MEIEGSGAATENRRRYPTSVVGVAFGVVFAAVLLSALAAWLVFPVPASAQEEGDAHEDSAMLRMAHLSPDAPQGDVYLDGKSAASLQDVPFGGVSAYFPVPAGSHEVKIYAAGETPETSEPILETGTDFQDGGWYTLAAVGLLGEGSLGARQFEDDHLPPREGKAKLRVIHAAPNVGPATVDARAESEDAQKRLFGVPGFSNASSYAELKAGTYDLTVKSAGTDEAALIVPNITFAEGEVRTVFVVEGASDGSLQALPAVDREGDTGKGNSGKGDSGKGDTEKGDTEKGDTGKGDTGKGDGGDTGSRKSGSADAPKPQPSVVNGTADDDLVKGTGEADIIDGKGGDDALYGRGGGDTLYGGGGHDGLHGGSGDDKLHGGGGDDRTQRHPVHGGSGDDTIWGDAGEDAVHAGRGDDTVHYTGDGEGDLVDCGPGDDTVSKGSDSKLDRFVGCEKVGD